jgi:hypothetical protein
MYQNLTLVDLSKHSDSFTLTRHRRFKANIATLGVQSPSLIFDANSTERRLEEAANRLSGVYLPHVLALLEHFEHLHHPSRRC